MPVIYGTKARKQLLLGIEQLSKAVAVTLGPRGRNVCMQKAFGDPLLTKDGVSVAKEIEVSDRWQNMGVRLLRDVASKTSDEAGDGTTTAIVMAGYLCLEGVKFVEAGIAPIELQRGMHKAAGLLVECVSEVLAVPVSTQADIEHIATVSANGDSRLGKIVAEAVAKVGKDGVIDVEEGKGLDILLKTTDGMRIDRGWVSSEFCLDSERQESCLENPYVFVSADNVMALHPMIAMLDELVKTKRPLFVIAPDFGGEALPTFIQNIRRGNLKTVCVKSPAFGMQQEPFLQDVAIYTGAQLFWSKLGMTLDSLTLDMLGSARSIKVNSKDTLIVDGGGLQENIDSRVASIRAEIERTGSDYDADKLKARMSRLLGGICTIEVGGHTELQVKELKARLEDALYATKSGLDEGIVVGGGLAYLRAAELVKGLGEAPANESERVGFDLVLRSCQEPFKQLIRNTGASGTAWVDRILATGSNEIGVDIRTMGFVDMFVEGIVDPAKVVKSVIANAVSVAATLLMTEAMLGKTVVASEVGSNR